MDNVEKIKDLLKDNPILLKTLQNLIDAPRERDEIYIYCLERETLSGEIHYIPLITFLGDGRTIMACNDVRVLQEDYKQEIFQYQLNRYPLIIIEVSFDTYVRLSVDIEKSLRSSGNKTIDKVIKNLKTESLFSNIDINKKEIPNVLFNRLQQEFNYCKCLNKDLKIVECQNYKPIKPLLAPNI